MKKQPLLLIVVSILLSINLFGQYSIPAGDVYGTWTAANSPYKIYGDIVVPDDSTLLIEPGVTIEFQGHHYLWVKGTVVADGTEDQKITFTMNDTAGFHIFSKDTGSWCGIYIINRGDPDFFMEDNDTSIFNHCIIEFTKTIRKEEEIFGDIGGAFNINWYSRLIISNCEIRNNYAYKMGGAIAMNDHASPKIINNYIHSNNSGVIGGGIGLWHKCNPEIYNNIITKNHCSDHGGGIFTHNGGSRVMNNKICNNTAYRGAGAAFESTRDLVSGNIIANNQSDLLGGALYIDQSVMELYNNTIVNNRSQWGGGISFGGISTSNFYNNIIWGNVIYGNGPDENEQVTIGSMAQPNFYNCIIQGGSDGIGKWPTETVYNGIYQNNLDVDPDFTAPSAGNGKDYDGSASDWSITIDGPGINQGVIPDNAENIVLTEDLSGNDRILHSIIDIGAIEKTMPNLTMSGLIDANEEWIADTIFITNDIKVKDSVTLTVCPGAVVEFQGYYQLIVEGTLIAKGKKEYMIKFTVKDTLGFHNHQQIDGSWRGIRFDNNTAQGKMTDNDTSYIDYCIIEFMKDSLQDNDNASAVYINSFSKLVISNSILRNNFASNGGAIWMDYFSNPIIHNNLIKYNVANFDGGGIYINTNSSPLIYHNRIMNNEAISNGGGILVVESSPLILNNLVCNNSAYHDGGGIVLFGATAVIAGNTITGNFANLNGCGMSIWDNHSTHENNIVRDNYSPFNDRMFWINKSEVSFSNCNIEGGENAFSYHMEHKPVLTLENIMDKDPQFIAPTNEAGAWVSTDEANFDITDFSPCINSGLNNHEVNELINFTDLNGNQRINQDITDIGAYENQGSPFSIIIEPYSQNKCKGDSTNLICKAEGNVKYRWQKNGETIPDENDSMLVLSQLTRDDEANYNCVVWNGYLSATTGNAYLVIQTAPEIIIEPSSKWMTPGNLCKAEALASGSEPIEYRWWKNDTLLPNEKSPVLEIENFNTTHEGVYRLTTSNDCGTDTSRLIYLSATPEICLVTVDSATNHNLITWEKSNNPNIASYDVYRESVARNVYDLIGNVPVSEIPVFVDSLANPKEQAYFYKITARNINDYVSPIELSTPHKTIHLLTTQGVQDGIQLDWDAYYGFPFSTYKIYRSIDNANFELVKEISSSNTTWTDFDAPVVSSLRYFVAVNKKTVCDPAGLLKASAGPFSRSISNLEDNRLKGDAIDNSLASKINLQVYPNPFRKQATIAYTIKNTAGIAIAVYNVMGEKLGTIVDESQAPGNYMYQYNPSKPGVYYLQFSIDGNMVVRKIIGL